MTQLSQILAAEGMEVGQRTLLPNPFLYTLPEEMWNKAKDHFGYSANFLPVGANASLTQPTSIQSDSAFIIVSASAVVTDTANTTRLSFFPALVQIQDQASGRNFFDAPVHFENVFGTVQEPGWWSIPKVILPGSTLQTQITNLDPANARNVRVIYNGFKVFNQRVQA